MFSLLEYFFLILDLSMKKNLKRKSFFVSKQFFICTNTLHVLLINIFLANVMSASDNFAFENTFALREYFNVLISAPLEY